MEETLNCPDCKEKLQRKFGLPATILTCLKCNRNWIKDHTGKLITEKEFHNRVKDWGE